jgi:hypothetical protein
MMYTSHAVSLQASIAHHVHHLYAVQLDPSLWDTFLDHLLYHMYHGSLPQGLAPGQVLHTLQLADRLGVPACVSSCRDYFGSVADDAISWEDVSSFYSLPEGLRESPDMAAAAKAFSKKLRSSYVQLEEAWRDEQLRDAFLQLPLPAVLDSGSS